MEFLGIYMLEPGGPNVIDFLRVLGESGISRLESTQLTDYEANWYGGHIERPFNVGISRRLSRTRQP